MRLATPAGTVCRQDLTGKPAPVNAKWSAALGATHTADLGAYVLTSQANYSYRTKSNLGLSNDPMQVQKAFGVLDARVAILLTRLLLLDRALAVTPGPLAGLHEAMRYAALGGGKRIRPLLAYAAGEVAAADPVGGLQHRSKTSAGQRLELSGSRQYVQDLQQQDHTRKPLCCVQLVQEFGYEGSSLAFDLKSTPRPDQEAAHHLCLWTRQPVGPQLTGKLQIGAILLGERRHRHDNAACPVCNPRRVG